MDRERAGAGQRAVRIAAEGLIIFAGVTAGFSSRATATTFVDEDQAVARAYGAVCTPDFFGLDREGRLRYRGRLDDARMADAADRTPELLNAMRRIAETGEGPEGQMPSMGCSIKWREGAVST